MLRSPRSARVTLVLLLTLAACSGGGGGGGTSSASTNDGPLATGGGRALHAGVVAGRVPWVDDPNLWATHTVAIVTQPAAGTASVSPSGDRWIYDPGTLASGAVSFGYRVLDPSGASTLGTAKVRVYDDAALARCLATSVVNLDGTLASRTRSTLCAFYSSSVTRHTAGGTAVTMDYLTHRPANGAEPKALLLLVGGADLDMGTAGDSTGVATAGGANFLVRSAQWFADAGYVTIAVDRPSDVTAGGADVYRFSPRHAVDLLRVARLASPKLDVFLVGTSRASLTVVSQNLIATAVSLSSPVTARGRSSSPYYVDPAQAETVLRPNHVARPAHVMWNDADGCTSITPPSGSAALADAIGASTTALNGGVEVTATGNGVTTLDPCGGLARHGYLGLEPEASAAITGWIDQRVAALNQGGNRRPEVAFVTVSGAAGTATQIDLQPLARDPDQDPLAFTLPFAASTLGGRVTLSGTVLTYTPPPGLTSATDDLVWIATDGHGHVAAAVLSVKIGD